MLDVILERMARKMLKQRPTLTDEEVEKFAAQKEPEIDLDHLTE